MFIFRPVVRNLNFLMMNLNQFHPQTLDQQEQDMPLSDGLKKLKLYRSTTQSTMTVTS